MRQPAAEFLGQAAQVGTARLDLGLVHEGPEGQGEVMGRFGHRDKVCGGRIMPRG